MVGHLVRRFGHIEPPTVQALVKKGRGEHFLPVQVVPVPRIRRNADKAWLLRQGVDLSGIGPKFAAFHGIPIKRNNPSGLGAGPDYLLRHIPG